MFKKLLEKIKDVWFFRVSCGICGNEGSFFDLKKDPFDGKEKRVCFNCRHIIEEIEFQEKMGKANNRRINSHKVWASREGEIK